MPDFAQRMRGLHAEEQLRALAGQVVRQLGDDAFRQLVDALNAPYAPTTLSCNDWRLISTLATIGLRDILQTILYQERTQ